MRFFEELRSAREGRGISIERLCADTKVNRRFIEALERGDYQALPGGVFRRGFVRAYLKAVGLDESDWMARFEQSYADLARTLGMSPESQEENWATFAVNVKRNRGAPRQQFWKRWLGVLAMLLVLMAAGWAVWHYLLQARMRASGGTRVSQLDVGPGLTEGAQKSRAATRHSLSGLSRTHSAAHAARLKSRPFKTETFPQHLKSRAFKQPGWEFLA